MKSLFLTAVFAASFSIFAGGGEKPARSFHLYYGNSPDALAGLTARFEPGAIVVVDTRVLNKAILENLLTDAKESGARVLGYLSIGEVHTDEVVKLQEYLKFHGSIFGNDPWTFESITIDRNETFNSYRIDVSAKPVRLWIRENAKEILDLGLDGLFLDTVDTVDTYLTRKEWNLERREHSVSDMISLIRSLKQQHPNGYILQNGGLNMIGEKVFIGTNEGILTPAQSFAKDPHPWNPDGILWENAFAGSDDWSKGRFEELCKIREAGHTDVFALGYEASFAKPADFFQKCRSPRFIGAWAKSSEVLHEAVTIPMPADDEPTGSAR